MKKITTWLFVGMLAIVFFTGCGRNISSQAEAIQAASKMPDFKKLISAESIYGGDRWPVRFKLSLSDSYDEKAEYYVIHVIVYEDASAKVKVVYLDDSRPPKIIGIRKKTG